MPKLPLGKIIALDTETDGFDVYRGARAFGWGFFTDLGEEGWIEADTPGAFEWLKALFNDSSRSLVMHNAKFDLKHFAALGVDIFAAKATCHCSLILAKCFNGMMPQYDLGWLSIAFLRRDPTDKTDVTDWIKANTRVWVQKYGRKPSFADVPRDMVSKRCLWDCESTFYLFMFFHPRVMKICPKLYETERVLQWVCVDMEDRGIKVDITRAKALREDARKGLDQIETELTRLICPLTFMKKKKGVEVPITVEAFNPNSSKLQLPAAWQKLGIELKFKTKPKKGKKGQKATGGGNWCFDEFAMIQYVSAPLQRVMRESSEDGWGWSKFYDAVYAAVRGGKIREAELVPPLILKARQLRKMISTYYDYIIENSLEIHIEPSGREVGVIHCQFNQSVAMTGRFSSSTPNMQNMPRILGPRECFIPRQGRRNWHFDYSQVEMRLFAHFARDPDMARAVEGDFHLYVSTQIYNCEESAVTKEQRKRAKGVGFGVLYGAGPPKVAETMTRKGLITSAAVSQALCARYHRRFPSVRRMTMSFQRDLVRVGYITNPLGRRYYIQKKQGYKCLNYMCQGTSADLMKAAMVKIWKWLRKHNLKSKILLTVHDELGIEIPRSEEALVVPKVLQLMQRLTQFFVPITVEAEVVVRRWSKKIDPADLGLEKLVG